MLTPLDPTLAEPIVPEPDNDKVSLPTVFEKIVNRLTLYEPVKLLEEYYYNYLINEETFINLLGY